VYFEFVDNIGVNVVNELFFFSLLCTIIDIDDLFDDKLWRVWDILGIQSEIVCSELSVDLYI